MLFSMLYVQLNYYQQIHAVNNRMLLAPTKSVPIYIKLNSITPFPSQCA